MDLRSEILACLHVTMIITLPIVTFTVGTAIIYKAGSYLGYPIGQFLAGLFKPFVTESQDQYGNPTKTPNYHPEQLAHLCGVFFAFTLCFAAFSAELVREGLKDVQQGASWDLWRVEGVMIRSCVEGLLTLVILRVLGKVVV
ncbi:hypothetical protein ASPWEDRAFT_46474 [Aspergillus wentii DTO 134E9]|uniref:Uncharacterized protein n=1 Tax=Aspergillus wentii DTO 134E9 TaxID=1073089 RepID=A0A1L9R478_ASPWE|nr:uncharacterized protein ASPWEDRAFT_46474 [Aspergillus wentii DTO 134E9]OJJ29731.1 hypothetical protein ASPWEDRAFT_46474 [Aspergillus wentii DTO 134E9]